MSQDTHRRDAGGDPVSELTGLTSAQVAQRVTEGRVNDVPIRASRTFGQIVRGNVFTWINGVIAVLFGVIAFVGPLKDGLFALVILINTLIGIVQETRAKRTLDKLAILNATRPRVLRDGELREVATQEVVVDDVIDIALNDQAVVDGVVVSSVGLEVDESLLTGEAEPVAKRPGDRVLSGSFVVAGRGRFRATDVGRAAYAARLADEASRYSLMHSELRSGINGILRGITWLLIPIGALLIYSQLFRGGAVTAAVTAADPGGTLSGPVADALRGTVAALVSMIPEGLILLTSVALAVGVVRLGRRNCLVEELPAIEGLARVDVICTDKTGTLTETGMRLAELRVLGEDDATPERAVDLRRVLAALAASDPRPNRSMAAVAEAVCSAPDWAVTALSPFSSARKWSGASFATPDGERHWVLGAPDVLLDGDRCGEVVAEAGRIAARGLRVLLLAEAGARVDPTAMPTKVRPAALVVLEQRIRSDAPATLDYFAGQKVTVKVVSGDNPESVGAVARELRLPAGDAPVDARDLPEEEAPLRERVAAGSAFGRVSPERKRTIVGSLRRRGHTVAMTGDGVNDVLALKEADVGVAMGSGSPAARSVAQIVLLDNRFATLPYVVAEGRRVIGNIERVANLFLTKTVYTMTVAIVVAVMGVAYPFFPLHATLINAVTFGIPAFFLALAPNTERVRPGFVRRTLRLAIPSGLVAGAATVATYLLVLGPGGQPDLADRTAALITLCAVTMCVLLLVAKPYVWWKVLLVGGTAAILVAAMVTSWGQEFFRLDPGDPTKVGIALVVAAVGSALVAAVRLVDDRWSRRREQREEPAPQPQEPPERVPVG